jgi:hypothetical protein
MTLADVMEAGQKGIPSRRLSKPWKSPTAVADQGYFPGGASV